jgi:hypothetical protein
VLVTGTLNNPTVAPDYKTIAQMKLENVLPATSGGIGGLVQSVIGGQQQAPAGSTQQPAEPGQAQPSSQPQAKPVPQTIQGILDALGGKQKNKQQQPAQQQPKQQPTNEEEKVPDPSKPK